MSGFTLNSPSVIRVHRHLEVKESTDAELEGALGLSRATVCAARKLLVDRGVVEWSGEKRDMPTGQPPKVWRVKKDEEG